MIFPNTSNVYPGTVATIPNLLLTLSHVKFELCNNALVPLPINNFPDVKVVVPIPPLEIGNIPEVILDAFIFVLEAGGGRTVY